MFLGWGPRQSLRGCVRWQVGGTDTLRALCASWHGAKPENVLVTVGAAEANSITVASLLRPGEQLQALTLPRTLITQQQSFPVLCCYTSTNALQVTVLKLGVETVFTLCCPEGL